MSLLVWLPLNGDLRNSGLAGDITVTNSGATVNAAGKIGKCYQFGTAASGISLSVDDLQSCSEVSVAFWIKIISWNTAWATFFQAGKNSHAWTDYIFGFLRNSSSPQIAFVIGNGSSTTTTYCSTGELELNTWYHIAGTFSSGQLRLYVNGDLVKEYSSTLEINSSVITKVTLGRANSTAYQSNCLMNDFRIYDHALSDREVKELAKGLVAHWKLDDLIGNENLLPKSDKAGNATTAWTWDGASAEAIDGYLKVYFTGSGHNRIYDYVVANTWVSGKTYTVSLWAKTDTDGLALRISRSIADYAPNIDLTSDWKYYSVQIQSTATSASGTISIQSNKTGVAWIKFVKLEEGSVATQWIPAKTDDMYSDWEFNVAHDSSGYGHEGIFIGNPLFTLDSPRYLGCLKMVNGSHVSFTNLPTLSEFTIAFWAAQSTGSNYYMVLGYSNGNRLNLYDLSNKFYWNTSDGNSNPFQDDSGVTVASTPYKGTIHHFAITGDGTQNLLYVDGVKIGKAKTYRSLTGSSLVVNGWATNSTAYSFNDRVSDIRIYATALSAEDIKELYNTSASIDNHHNVYAREFVED